MANKRLKRLKSIVKTGRSVCALCLEKKPLKNSHILPEFFYKRMYDENHNFLGLSQNPAHDEVFLDKGLRENLLCAECELNFSKYEDYAYRVFYGGTEIETCPQAGELLLKGVDYKKFRLFLLSLLWRMGVSEISFFSEVRLGPFEEKLRCLILKEDPGEPGEFWCTITSVQHEGEHWHWSLSADRARTNGQHCYRMVIDGFLFFFFVTNQKPPLAAKRFYIKKDTTLSISRMSLIDIPFLASAVGQMGSAIRNRQARQVSNV